MSDKATKMQKIEELELGLDRDSWVDQDPIWGAFNSQPSSQSSQKSVVLGGPPPPIEVLGEVLDIMGDVRNHELDFSRLGDESSWEEHKIDFSVFDDCSPSILVGPCNDPFQVMVKEPTPSMVEAAIIASQIQFSKIPNSPNSMYYEDQQCWTLTVAEDAPEVEIETNNGEEEEEEEDQSEALAILDDIISNQSRSTTNKVEMSTIEEEQLKDLLAEWMDGQALDVIDDAVAPVAALAAPVVVAAPVDVVEVKPDPELLMVKSQRLARASTSAKRQIQDDFDPDYLPHDDEPSKKKPKKRVGPKDRKRDQNKTAALRYRLKKKQQQEQIEQLVDEQLIINKELKSTFEQLEMEMGFVNKWFQGLNLPKNWKQYAAQHRG